MQEVVTHSILRRLRPAESQTRLNENGTWKRLLRLSTVLSLSATQEQRLREIFANLGSQIRKELNGRRNGRTREELRQAMRVRMKQVDRQIQELLGPEQLRKYRELKSANKV